MKDMNDQDPTRLIDAYLDGIATPEQVEALRQWLSQSKENVREFVDYANLHSYTRQMLLEEDINQARVDVLGEMIERGEIATGPSGVEGNEAGDSISGLIALSEIEQSSDQSTRDDRPAVSRLPELESENRRHRVVFRIPGMSVYRTVGENNGVGVVAGIYSHVKTLLAAAAVLLAVTVVVFSVWERERTDVTLATLTGVHQAVWSTGEATRRDDGGLTRGRYGLEGGFAELRTVRGATVLLEGPCEFELVDDNTVYLHRGVVTARVPESALMFTIDTPTARVVDLGTEFGVEVKESGHTVAAVFQGRVELGESGESGEAAERKIDLRAGKQAYVDTAGRLSESAEAIGRDHVFSRTLAEARVKPRVHGSAAWYPQGMPSVAMGESIDRGRAVVFLESRDVSVEGDMAGVMVDAGRYTNWSLTHADGYVVDGSRVDSYLVHYDVTEPIEGVEGLRRLSSVSGEITFPREVVGVLGLSDQLNETDSMFARAGTRYLHARSDVANEFASKRGLVDSSGPYDTVEIMPDRRTVRFQLNATTIDQFRVLIAGE